MFDVAINGNAADKLNTEVLPETYIVVYVPSGQESTTLFKSSSSRVAASNPGEFAASVNVFSKNVPAVNLPPDSIYVPIMR